jgi:uncharacterized hydantoinase/oxoprolinase family protein
VLGVDIGNAKLKLGVGAPQPDSFRWVSRHLPYTPTQAYQRFSDFEQGIPACISDFLSDLERDRLQAVVFVSSSGYAYPTYHQGVVHSARILKEVFPHLPVFGLNCHLDLIPDSQIREQNQAILDPLCFTNGMGAAWLAMRSGWFGNPASGICLDTGGTTTQACCFVDGSAEPHSCSDPEHYLEHRLRFGKAIWVGTQTTPLEYLATEVPLGCKQYPVIPRGVTMDHVAVVLERLDPVRSKKLSLFGAIPTRSQALRAMADVVNLDHRMASEQELCQVAQFFESQAHKRLEQWLRVALEQHPAACQQRAMLFGLGADWLSQPALEAAGVPRAGIALASEFLPVALAEVASCLGACFAGWEHILGTQLTLAQAGVGLPQRS